MKPTTKRDVHKSYRISIGEEGAIILRFADEKSGEPLIFSSYAEAPGWVRHAMQTRPGNRHGDYFVAPLIPKEKSLQLSHQDMYVQLLPTGGAVVWGGANRAMHYETRAAIPLELVGDIFTKSHSVGHLAYKIPSKADMAQPTPAPATSPASSPRGPKHG